MRIIHKPSCGSQLLGIGRPCHLGASWRTPGAYYSMDMPKLKDRIQLLGKIIGLKTRKDSGAGDSASRKMA